MSMYASLAYTKALLSAETTVDDSKLLRLIRDASRRLDLEMGLRRPLFLPWKENRAFVIDSYHVNSTLNTFDVSYHVLGGALLAIAAVAQNGSTLTLNTDVYGYPSASVPPFRALRFGSSERNWYDACGIAAGTNTVTIDGVWGYHLDYANAWIQVDTLTVDISESATSLTVSDVDGVDAYGWTPRISAGHLLKIGDEFLEVTATNTTTNTATVRRGVHGTTAAAHSTSDAVSVWQVEAAVQHAVARQAGLLYARRGAYQTVEVQGMSEVRFPADLLQEVRAVLQAVNYAY